MTPADRSRARGPRGCRRDSADSTMRMAARWRAFGSNGRPYRRQLRVRYQATRSRVRSNEGEPLRLGQRVNRHEYRAGHQDGVHRHRVLDTAFEKDEHPVPRLDTVGAQRVRQRPASPQQVAVRDATRPVHERCLRGSGPGRAFEGVMQQHRSGRHRGAGPLDELLMQEHGRQDADERHVVRESDCPSRAALLLQLADRHRIEHSRRAAAAKD